MCAQAACGVGAVNHSATVAAARQRRGTRGQDGNRWLQWEGYAQSIRSRLKKGKQLTAGKHSSLQQLGVRNVLCGVTIKVRNAVRPNQLWGSGNAVERSARGSVLSRQASGRSGAVSGRHAA